MEMENLNEEIMRSNLSVLSADLPEFPDSGYLAAHRTYVISADHTVTTSTMAMPAGVTLCFMGGRLYPSSSNVTLTGNNTKIIAPIGQIFDLSLNVRGTWNIDRAYPQWFGAQSYMDMRLAGIDSSTAINKAIVMKGTGEVFLPRGMYAINSTIEVKAGIELVGELGAYNAECIEGDHKFGTILVPNAATPNNYTNGYLMRINMSGNTWEVAYVNPGTTVKNIIFLNSWKDRGIPNQKKGIPDLKGICTAGSFVVDTCLWSYFKQAIYNVFLYSDLRKIVNCTFNSPENIHTGEPLYAFDLGALGDALIFEHNGIHNISTYAKALHINMCNGGSINANIINNDVLIKDSKGITFSSNHMEEGGQVVINSSSVTSMNNFFQKGSNPNLVVGTSVVKSSGDMFVFYDKEYIARYHDNNVDNVLKVIPTDPSNPDYPVYQDYIATKNYLDGICEYDIEIDGNSSLEVSQTYRNWLVSGLIGRINTCGIKIGAADGRYLGDFNDYSHLLSSGSRIMPGYKVIKSAYADNLLAPSSSGNGYHGDCKWHLDTGYYYYKYQILWDRERKIIGQSGTYSWDGSGRIYMMKYTEKYTGNYLKDPRRGLLLLLDNALGCGNQAMLRLYRGTSSNYTQYVDIPVAGTNALYDNGISVCGFKWKNLVSAENITAANTNITSIRYTGQNIECKAPAVPTQGKWQEGDIVYNTNPSSSISYWICLGPETARVWRAKS